MNDHEKVIEKCAGCNYVSGDCCRVYLSPAAKWRAGNCVMCTTLARGKDSSHQKKQRIGQQKSKQSKRLSKKQANTYSKLGR